MNENDTPNENDAQKKPAPTEKPLFPARTFPAVYLVPGDPPAPPMVESEADQQTRARLMQEAADASERAGAGIVAAFEKAHWMDKIFARILKTLSRPEADHLEDDAAAMIHAVQEQAKTQSPEAIALAFDCLSIGVKLGRVPETRIIVEDELRKIQNTLEQLQPHVAGVPAVVEQANENKREGMGELYRVLYAPGFSPKQKAIADAMRETANHVRQASPILKRNGWKGVSPGRVSIELAKMDKLFADAKMTNPFASREHNRKRPVTDTTYSERKTDSDNPDSPVEIVPNRPGGYSRDET